MKRLGSGMESAARSTIEERGAGSANDEVTGQFLQAIAPTEPAPAAPDAFVQQAPRGTGMPLGLLQRFDNIQRIGAGGMGVVYRAFDVKLGREVALKLLKHGEPTSWAKFSGEARAQARVEHDHICRVYDVGEAEGEPYIVMQLIDGEPLSLVRSHMNLRQRVELAEKVARAIAAAHAAGLVHRDIKPGNILVERKDDGSFRPYVVDFGIASVVEGGVVQTLQGALGTPAYMAPEVQLHQKGKVIDVRVDVYGLGATLYDLLGGRPPFIGADALDILAKLGREDPPPLRAIAKSIPMELEAIVMKCIDREPNRRYATMEALSDDLRRFLEGEPIMARRVGLRYTLRRLARKHGRTLFVGAAAFALMLTFVVVRRNAAVQAELAKDLGRTVTEMELYMRTAHQMPPHDIERERTVVRERIKTLEQRFAGDTERDPSAYYALGRAYFTLGENVRACEYLEQAKRAGYASNELTYALARAQHAAYMDLTRDVEWYGSDPQQIAKECEAIKARYLTPALQLLGSAEHARIEEPMYARALMATWEDRREDAVEKARAAFNESPLLYEAKVVEGEALAEIATRHWHSGRSDWWQSMSAGMEKAIETLVTAENIARSDPTVLQAVCGARTRLMYAAYSSKKVRVLPYFEAAREACERLVAVDPSSPTAHMSRANMHALYAYAAARFDEPEGDPVKATEEAIGIAEQAMRLSAGGLPAYQALGNALLASGRILLDRGLAATAVLETAEKHFEKGRSIFKHNDSLQDGAVNLQYYRTIDDRRHGVDVGPRIERVEILIREVIAARPRGFNAYLKRGLMHVEHSRQQVEWGQWPKKSFDTVLEAMATAKQVNPAFTFVYNDAEVHEIMARYALDAGTPAADALDQMAKNLETLHAEESDTVQWVELSGIEATLRAREQMERKRDPEPFLDSARQRFRKAIERSPHLVELAVGAARVEVLIARFDLEKKRATPASFELIRKPLQAFLSSKHDVSDAFALAAESHALAGAWRLSQNESAEEDVRAGLASVSRAIAINPKHARALATRGRLWLLRAKSATDEDGRTKAARQAIEAFLEAFRCNPLLERVHGKALKEARGI